jgi:hypothetical protein
MGRSLRFVRYMPIVVMLLVCETPSARAIKVPRGFNQCNTLQVCINLLDSVVPARDIGDWENGDVIAHHL